MEQMNFLMNPPLDIFEYNLETEEHEWKHYYSDSQGSNDTIPYNPKNENWHYNISTLDGRQNCIQSEITHDKN